MLLDMGMYLYIRFRQEGSYLYMLIGTSCHRIELP